MYLYLYHYINNIILKLISILVIILILIVLLLISCFRIVEQNNVLVIENEFTYRYSNDGSRRQVVGPAAKRFYFVGIFMSIGEDKTD